MKNAVGFEIEISWALGKWFFEVNIEEYCPKKTRCTGSKRFDFSPSSSFSDTP